MKFKVGDEVYFNDNAYLGDLIGYATNPMYIFKIDYISNHGEYPYNVCCYDSNNNVLDNENFNSREIKHINTTLELSNKVEALEDELKKAKEKLAINMENEVEDKFEAGAIYEFDMVKVVIIQTEYKQDRYVLGGLDGNPFNLYSASSLNRDDMINYLKNCGVEYIKTISDMDIE